MKIILRSYPLKKKQDTPFKVGTKELHMEVKTPNPCAPKLMLKLKGSSNPSKGIDGTFPKSYIIERQKIERSKAVKSENSIMEKGEVGWSDVRGLSHFFPNLCNFIFSSCLKACAGIIEARQVRNLKM